MQNLKKKNSEFRQLEAEKMRLSEDLCEKIVAAVANGMKKSDISKAYNVSRPTINLAIKRLGDSGNYKNKARPGWPRTKAMALFKMNLAQHLKRAPITSYRKYTKKTNVSEGTVRSAGREMGFKSRAVTSIPLIN